MRDLLLVRQYRVEMYRAASKGAKSTSAWELVAKVLGINSFEGSGLEPWPCWITVLCSWARQFTLTVPLSTYIGVYK